MDPKEMKRKLSTSEIASPSSSKMDLKKKKKKQKLSKSQSLVNASPSPSKMDRKKKKKKKQKLSKLLVMASPSLSKIELEQAMKKQNDVGMFLTGEVISALAKNTNFVFSPTSIYSALTILAATSDNEPLKAFILSFLRSSSTDELNAVFHKIASVVLVDGSESGGSTSGGPTISAVNGVWMEQSLPVKPSVKDLFENFFKATFAQVDFRYKAEEIRMEVNSWAENHTNGHIKNLFPQGSVTRDTDFVYGNALYFKGSWERTFPKCMTKDEQFHLLDGTSVSVPFMQSMLRRYVEAYDGFKVLQLPFRKCGDMDRSFAMYFYLPDEKDGLSNLVKKMTSTPGFVDDHIPTCPVGGELRIPKFKIEFGFEAAKAFNQLELDSVQLYHKALVEIDEDGAEAAAATLMRIGRTGRTMTRIDFVADHPFLFLIREGTTGTVLFIGQVYDPSKSSST